MHCLRRQAGPCGQRVITFHVKANSRELEGTQAARPISYQPHACVSQDELSRLSELSRKNTNPDSDQRLPSGITADYRDQQEIPPALPERPPKLQKKSIVLLLGVFLFIALKNL